MMRIDLRMCVLLLVLVSRAVYAQEPMNVVVILTDDQRWDSLWAMPILQEKLISRGVNFSNAIVTTPLCCPFRAGFHGGGYLAQNTGVLSNNPPSGGVGRFVDTNTMALQLQVAGHRTLLVGRYMSGYENISPKDSVTVNPILSALSRNRIEV